MSYTPPIREMRFALDHVVGVGDLIDTGAFEDLGPDLLDAIVEEAGRFTREVIAPLNLESDRTGARFENGRVRTAPGFKEAYGQYVDGGWNALAAPTEYGGQGLPFTLSAVLQDAMHGACMAFGIGPTLTLGAIKAIKEHGSDELKKRYLPKLISGAWTGAMCLTEPQAGSDVGALKTKAVPAGDGSYLISGSKIFITYGDHDMTDNIIHLVLARLPDAPPGTKGISLFLVPKVHVNDDDTLGAANDFKPISIEHKLGLHGSPTCVMSYGENGACVGYLIGEENKGMAAMFTMMNAARLDVGLQGVGVAERAFQHALAYAQDRHQGRRPGAREANPIIDHPDVRRMLYTMKAQVEASRAICYANAVAIDLALTAKTEEARAQAKAREELLTPIAKAWSTDVANEVASLCVQIHGGMGYIEETGAAQHYRDARIAAIYEGTNGIQAIDLVARKLPMSGGAAVTALFDEAAETASQLLESEDAALNRIGKTLERELSTLWESTNWLNAALTREMDDALAGATPFLRQMALVVGGFYLGRGALAAKRLLSEDPGSTDYYKSRIAIADFYAQNLLSQAGALSNAVMAGADTVAPIAPDLLAG